MAEVPCEPRRSQNCGRRWEGPPEQEEAPKRRLSGSEQGEDPEGEKGSR